MYNSPHLRLHLTPATDSTKRFKDFRTELAGDAADSNMMIIDTAIADIDDRVGDILGIDTTLTEEGYAADAKATGEKIKDIVNSIDSCVFSDVNNDGNVVIEALVLASLTSIESEAF